MKAGASGRVRVHGARHGRPDPLLLPAAACRAGVQRPLPLFIRPLFLTDLPGAE